MNLPDGLLYFMAIINAQHNVQEINDKYSDGNKIDIKMFISTQFKKI